MLTVLENHYLNEPIDFTVYFCYSVFFFFLPNKKDLNTYLFKGGYAFFNLKISLEHRLAEVVDGKKNHETN